MFFTADTKSKELTAIMSDNLPTEIESLRRDVDALKAALGSIQPTGPQEGSFADQFMGELRNNLLKAIDEKNGEAGIAAGFVIVQTDAGRGNTTTRYSIVTAPDVADLPTDEKIDERIQRLAPLIQTPLTLRALREFAKLRFERKGMRRTATQVAIALGVSEEEMEAVFAPLVANGTLRQVKTGGEEFYEWDGNGMAMVLLVHG